MFATTKQFLNDFALKSLSELPELNSALTAELEHSNDTNINPLKSDVLVGDESEDHIKNSIDMNSADDIKQS